MSQPAVHDNERQFGLAHRLDTICSGLLLAAVTFEAYTLLKWQLSRGTLMHEYMVFCHGSALSKLQEVDVHIFQPGGERNYKAGISTCGAPSHAVITVQVHSALSSQSWRVLPG